METEYVRSVGEATQPPRSGASPTRQPGFFLQRYGITSNLIHKILEDALTSGCDYAELYFEHEHATQLGVEEHKLTVTSEGVSVGCGVRVLKKDRAGYAYTELLEEDSLRSAAKTAALIAGSMRKHAIVPLPEHAVYKAQHYLLAPLYDTRSIDENVRLIRYVEDAARGYSPCIRRAQVGLSYETKHILVANSDGLLVEDEQPLTKLSVAVLAVQDGSSARGYSGGGGRISLSRFVLDGELKTYAHEACRQAMVQLSARPMQVGQMRVVLGPGWPGILLHEAIGHGLEADFIYRKTSAFTELRGSIVANEKVSIVDDGTVPGRRGSINIDDEGQCSRQTTLITRGRVDNFLSDKVSARMLSLKPTGNGRRESYRSLPLPRMTNTFMLPGDDAPEDILRSTKQGLYVANVGGGQVDITNGTFVFTTTEAYMIEDGKLTAPVKHVTLIGDGLSVLKYVDMVGSDLQLDGNLGTCGKEGQSVPVCVGMPTVSISQMTVGGTE